MFVASLGKTRWAHSGAHSFAAVAVTGTDNPTYMTGLS